MAQEAESFMGACAKHFALVAAGVRTAGPKRTLTSLSRAQNRPTSHW